MIQETKVSQLPILGKIPQVRKERSRFSDTSTNCSVVDTNYLPSLFSNGGELHISGTRLVPESISNVRKVSFEQYNKPQTVTSTLPIYCYAAREAGTRRSNRSASDRNSPVMSSRDCVLARRTLTSLEKRRMRAIEKAKAPQGTNFSKQTDLFLKFVAVSCP